MSTAGRLHYSYEEYLRSLETSPLKLEYCDGVIYAMAGGTPVHAELGASVIQVLGRALPAGCKAYTSDLMIRVDASDLSTFPDVAVVCGAREVSRTDQNAVINPSVLVEVTSKSTADYDRGEKLSHYKQLPSLRAVLFVSHERAQVTLVERTTSGWQEREFRAGEVVTIDQPSISFEVSALYAGISLV